MNDPPTPEVYTLSLHDALPIFVAVGTESDALGLQRVVVAGRVSRLKLGLEPERPELPLLELDDVRLERSEEHTSELQSRFELVCRLLLEKKKSQTTSPSASAWW